VEYYYMWKTTDRYVQQKRVKAVEAESKLKQVYVPPFNSKAANNQQKGISNGNSNGTCVSENTKPCESCAITTSTQVLLFFVVSNYSLRIEKLKLS
jgi:metastasis-associated protein MTA